MKLERNLLAEFYMELFIRAWGNGQTELALDYLNMANEVMS